MRPSRLRKVALKVGLGLLVVSLACSSTEPPTRPGGGPVEGINDLIAALQAAGADVVRAGVLPIDSNPFFSVATTNLKVDGLTVHVWEYATAAEADAEAALVGPDGYEIIGRAMVDWVGPPHWYRGSRILVLYVGRDEAVLSMLASVLGPQIAGS